MDAAASSATLDENINKVYGLMLKLEDSTFPSHTKQKHTVVKYTKLPEFEFDSKVKWPHNSYTLPPRLRRIITLDDPLLQTTRSVKFDMPGERATAMRSRRKIVTISEDEENDLHPRFGKETDRKSPYKTNNNISNRAIQAAVAEKPRRNTSRLKTPSKNVKEIKPCAKQINDVNISRLNYKVKHPLIGDTSNHDSVRSRKAKDSVRSSRSNGVESKPNVNSRLCKPTESERQLMIIKKGLLESNKKDSLKKPLERKKQPKSSPRPSKSTNTAIKELPNPSKAAPVIRVPLDEKCLGKQIAPCSVSEVTIQCSSKENKHTSPITGRVEKVIRKDQATEMTVTATPTNVEMGTDPFILTVDQITDMDDFKENSCKIGDPNIETNFTMSDSLTIPNVTLTKEKSNTKYLLESLSAPNLQVSMLKNASQENILPKSNFQKSGPFIIGRATLTYTTKQKINIQVVGKETSLPNLSPSPLPTYPISVVSVFKKEINNRASKKCIVPERTSQCVESNIVEDNLKSTNCPSVLNSDKLVKPSEIISEIRVKRGLLQTDYMSEQFQRELNFIDSFFESLQYLENSSLSDKCVSLNRPDNWISKNLELDNSEYSNFLSKLENGAMSDDSHTMASKSLCLLNLLIQDEQRRAKNLLFVLKMREDALKDFTKSQLLWLENKKKLENTDISTLKKKQRGALLKLQHECGEMQRMRKALLTLSEKRKSALMKTKKNIELKLTSSVDVEKILHGKKKLRRSAAADRCNVPLKCFELSSSGCEDMVRPTKSKNHHVVSTTASAEKCVQTGDSVLEKHTAHTAAEDCVVVDGGYLNILFQDLKMPQIFNNGKQYEVNEEALTNILNSVNAVHLNDTDVIENFMDQMKGRDDKSTTPSTARSLVEELDQYYKILAEEDKEYSSQDDNVFDSNVQIETLTSDNCMEPIHTDYEEAEYKVCDEIKLCENVETQTIRGQDLRSDASQAGPQQLAIEEAAVCWPVIAIPSVGSSTVSMGASSQPPCPTDSALALASPVDCEAERLRRQQIAIEREIKALEQQQCQILVVREIPDKPPPPYMPPSEVKPKSPRKFSTDETTHQKICIHLEEPLAEVHSTDSFEVYVKDFCDEVLENRKVDQSEAPWDACNLLPKRPETDVETLAKTATAELKEVLSVVPPTTVSGLSTRRSDHIDDILFAEWRRCEPEWTSLHVDEAVVKNQVFESIFQKVLSETIDEYKRNILGLPVPQ